MLRVLASWLNLIKSRHSRQGMAAHYMAVLKNIKSNKIALKEPLFNLLLF